MGMKQRAGRLVWTLVCASAAALAGLGACATRDVPARYAEDMPASPQADAPRAPAAAVVLTEGTTSHAPQTEQEAGQPSGHSHSHGAGHGH